MSAARTRQRRPAPWGKTGYVVGLATQPLSLADAEQRAPATH